MLDIAFSTVAAAGNLNDDVDAVLFREGTPVAVALLLGEDGPRPALYATLDRLSHGMIGRAVAASEFTGARGKSLTLTAPLDGVSRVVLVGVGRTEELDALGAERAGGSAAASLSRDRHAIVAADALPEAFAPHVALGATLRSYRFDRYRTRETQDDRPRLRRLTVTAAPADPAAIAPEARYVALKAVAEGVFLARDLVSEPANVLTPAVFAERIAALGGSGLEIEILGPERLAELGFGALLGVAQGSTNEPRVAIMRWNGGAEGEAPLGFIGKGVTFDSGGISIKPASGMEDMKWDMAGAGTVVGLMAALAGRRAKINALGIVGLVENMLSGNAQRPGDVVTSYSGQTIEVLNTDAEGRLVLADVLWYAQERFKPRFMIDLATLTGAIIVGLGHEHAGLFSNDDILAAQLADAGEATGEAVWRMPMGEAYDKLLRSDIADMKNIGGRPGGSITAAQFLKRFVNNTPWAHLDIAGTAWSSKDTPCVPKGATAFGVRLLDRLVSAHFED